MDPTNAIGFSSIVFPDSHSAFPAPPPIVQLPLDFSRKYRLIRQLGQGGSGFVYSAVRIADGRLVAIKFIYRNRLAPNRLAYDREYLRNGGVMVLPMEIYILLRIQHPNIIRFVEFSCDRTFFYMITELHGTSWPRRRGYGDGDHKDDHEDNTTDDNTTNDDRRRDHATERPMDLFECIETRGAFPEDLARHVFRQVVDACSYLKSMNVWHMDIKDENIVIDTDYRVKIIDFGSANIIPAYGDHQTAITATATTTATNSTKQQQQQQQQQQLPLFRRFYGTLAYAPPEVLRGEAYRADLADIWCLGVLFYTLLSGEPPFKTAEAATTTGTGTPATTEPLPMPKNPVGASSWALLQGMLRKAPLERISLEQIQRLLSHPDGSG